MIEAWSLEKHAGLIGGWIESRGLGRPEDAFEFLPPTGLVVDSLAAGWLFKTDAKQCFLGGIIADPGSSPELRAKALDSLILGLVAKARDLGYTSIAGTPSIPSLISRFQALGFATQVGAFAIRRV